MVSYCMLQDHDCEHLLGDLVNEFALIDQCDDTYIESMDAFIGSVVHVQEELISEVPEMVFGLNG